MQEAFIHYLWKTKKVSPTISTTNGKQVEIHHYGQHNDIEGSDFFNVQLTIDTQKWAGNVEMHLKSSDWNAHKHSGDQNYENVILHVVWEHDIEIQRKDGTIIPCIQLKDHIDAQLINNYNTLFSNQSRRWIHCENDIDSIDNFTVGMWKEKLFLERMEARQERVMHYFELAQKDWEATLFKLLLRSFGTKVNAESFELLGDSTPFKVIRKEASSKERLESLLMGQAALLEENMEDAYHTSLKAEYEFQQKKYSITPTLIKPKFFKLRPPNFPTLRLSQLAHVYFKTPNLFGELMLTSSLDRIYEVLDGQASQYWDTKYSFAIAIPHPQKPKKLTKAFKDLLIINCIIPLKFAYARYQGKDILEDLIQILRSLKPEVNTITRGFNSIRKGTVTNAMDSQSVIHLKNNYCDEHQCLKCALGNQILGR